MGVEGSDEGGGPPSVAPKPLFGFTSQMRNDTYPEIQQSNQAGRSVLVTGSNRGVGRAILMGFARRGASRLALCSRKPAPDVAEQLRSEARAAGHPEPDVLELTPFDVTSQTDVDAAAAAVAEKWGGRLDILVNNSGLMTEDCFESLAEVDLDQYMRAWDVNFLGAVRVAKALVPMMLKGGGERTVINVSSQGALFTAGGGESYCVTKVAMARVAEFWCDGLKEQGLLAFSIHPGGFMTELASRLPKYLWPMLNDPEVLAGDAVTFLTDKRREWLAGRWINCNWDLPELMSMEEQIVAQDWLKFSLSGVVLPTL